MTSRAAPEAATAEAAGPGRGATWPVVVMARDGRPFRLRPIRPEDAAPLQRAFRAMPAEDKRARLLSGARELSDTMAAGFTHLEPGQELCLVIEDPARPGEVLGGARFMGEPDGRTGEFSVSISAELKGLGLARQALAEVLRWARDHGYAESWGTILASNPAMLGLARRLGFQLRRDPDDFTLVLATLPLESLDAAGT